jgi:hypothetical protein
LIIRKLSTVAGLVLAGLTLSAGNALAHDCFNPNRDANAPHAGVNYTVTGFGPTGPNFVQTGPGKGIGGFAAIAPGVFGNLDTVYVKTIGNSSQADGVVGPGPEKAGSKACDGKGIDYLSACFGG